jgi:hypothetical protein
LVGKAKKFQNWDQRFLVSSRTAQHLEVSNVSAWQRPTTKYDFSYGRMNALAHDMCEINYVLSSISMENYIMI